MPPRPASTSARSRVDPQGLMFRPVVACGVSHDSRLAREEVFGPVVAVVDVAGYDEGLTQINDSTYGLTAGICTRDLGTSYDFAARAQVGVVKVNRPTTGLDLNVPFGGVRDSSTQHVPRAGRTGRRLLHLVQERLHRSRPVIRTDVDALPKAELHLHFEAAMSRRSAVELADRYGRTAPATGAFAQPVRVRGRLRAGPRRHRQPRGPPRARPTAR